MIHHIPTVLRQFRRNVWPMLMAVWVCVITVNYASAQGFEGAPRGGFGGPPPDVSGMGRPGFGGPPPASAMDTPITALQAGLNLSANQTARIAQIQQDRHWDQPGGGGEDKAIKALLNGSQRKTLPGLLKRIDSMRSIGLPAGLYGDLRLTDGQQKQIEGIAQSARPALRGPQNGNVGRGTRQKLREKALAVLTVSQKSLVTKYEQAHPRSGPGGGYGPPPDGMGPPPGGFGPPPGGPHGRGPNSGFGGRQRQNGPPGGGPPPSGF